MKIKVNISYYKRILLKTPFHILMSKVINKFIVKVKDYYRYRRAISKGSVISDEDFIKEIGLKRHRELYEDSLSQELIDFSFLNSILNSSERKFIFSTITEKERRRILVSADDIYDHKFNLLGSGKVNVAYGFEPEGVEGYYYNKSLELKELNDLKKRLKEKIAFLLDFDEIGKNIEYDPIDWHLDFKSGYRWESDKWYKRIVYGNLLGVDVKIPWELSRFQHLVLLGQAYLITGDEKYSMEYICQIIDWVENNRPQFGVNWKCTMDVAIRAANWVLSLSFFKGSRLMTKKFLLYFIKNIYIHGKHIFDNLEYDSITSNHYLSDISGIFFIAGLLGKQKIGRKWLAFSLGEFKKEIDKQVYEDGTDFEASTCYHRLVLELLFFPLVYSIKKSIKFNGKNYFEVGVSILGGKFIGKIFKMFDFIFFTLKPNGKMAQIGDNDNGRLFIFKYREVLDMSYLLTLGAIFFRESKFKVKEFDFSEEALWIFGKAGYKIWQELNINCVKNIKSRSFYNGGLYIMRRNSDYLIASCGQNGQNGNGGHAHNDKLSFELCIKGTDIIIDPGSYLYTPVPELRNKFRSTFFHNTVMVDNEEQNRFKEFNLFSLENDSLVVVNKWECNGIYDFLDAEHYGFKRLKNPVIHRRQFFFSKEYSFWLIRDILDSKGNHIYNSYFHFSDRVIINIDKSALVVSTKFDNKDFKIIPLQVKSLGLSLEEGWCSSSYGKKVASSIINYFKQAETSTEFIFLLTLNDFNRIKTSVESFLSKIINGFV